MMTISREKYIEKNEEVYARNVKKNEKLMLTSRNM